MSNFTLDNEPTNSYINGMRVYVSALLTNTRPADKAWYDVVLEWNPCNHWSKPPIAEPSDEVYIIGDKIIMHPMHLRVMQEQMPFAEVGYS